jgi:cell fate regulator YaaT (PSP1 superfamily)
MNTFDWLSALDIEDPYQFDTVEISFKNGSRKEFFKNPSHTRSMTGDMVLVESDNGGYDLGRISLSGELVRAQMKKKGIKEKTVLQSVIRKANERDLERLQEAREAEKPTMVKARAIARSLALDMKVGDVEYQGDKRKATFYYTADGRVDFRELIREFAREFKVKIEMRQIGARQESARVGGLGPCGRELCCSTWLTDFKSVSTVAARYQNLAINQSKLSGQCGRLKCCLNYELDSYIDALEHFPSHADKIHTEEGSASLVKTDIFKGLMYYCYDKDHGRGKFYPLDIDQVKEILEANKSGLRPPDLSSLLIIEEEEIEVGFDGDLTGVVELPNEKKKKKKNNKRKREGDIPMVKGSSSSNNRFAGNRRPEGDRNPAAPTDERAKNERSDRRPERGDRSERPERRDENRKGGSPQAPRPERNKEVKPIERRSEQNQPRPEQAKNEQRPQQPPRPPRPEQAKNEQRPQQPQRPPRPEQANNAPKVEQQNKPQNPQSDNTPPQNEQNQGGANSNKNKRFKNFKKNKDNKGGSGDKDS